MYNLFSSSNTVKNKILTCFKHVNIKQFKNITAQALILVIKSSKKAFKPQNGKSSAMDVAQQ
jgi:hypothetical protein